MNNAIAYKLQPTFYYDFNSMGIIIPSQIPHSESQSKKVAK